MANSLSSSAKHYRRNKRSRDKKKAYDSEFNKKPEQLKKRIQLNRENRRRGTYANGDKKDLSHTKNGLVYKDQSVNRGSNSDSAGDRRARRKRKR